MKSVTNIREAFSNVNILRIDQRTRKTIISAAYKAQLNMLCCANKAAARGNAAEANMLRADAVALYNAVRPIMGGGS
jgi:hypothetical protein